MVTNKYIPAPLTSQATEYITIKNDSDQTIAFKVKTTAPKVYCVRPNAALVPSGESVQVQVILLGLKTEPAPSFKCKDKFLVIALPAPYDLGETSVADAWPQLEAEFKDKGLSKKIKVNYVFDAEPKATEEKTSQVEPEVITPVPDNANTTGIKATEEDSTKPVQKKPVEKKIVVEEPKLQEKTTSTSSSEPATTSSIVPAVVIWVVIGFLLWYWLS